MWHYREKGLLVNYFWNSFSWNESNFSFMYRCVLFKNQLKQKQKEFDHKVWSKRQKERHLIQHRRFVMLKVLKVLSLFEKTFPKNFQRLRTKNYQIFEVKLREFLMLLESLSSKRIILINDNQVAIAIFYYFD